MVAPATYRIERKDGPAFIACGKFDLGGSSDEPLFIAPMFSGVIDAKGEPNKSPWVCPFWHIPAAPKGHKATLGIKFVQRSIGGYNIRVPVMVNAKDIAESTELTFDKVAANSVLSSRSPVDETISIRAAKRRKLV